MTKSILMIAVIAFIAIGCNNQSTSGSSTDSTSTAATAPKTDMTSENKAKALALLEAFNKHDASLAFKDAAPDIVDYGDGSTPPAKGIDSCKAFMQSYFAAFPDIKGENLMAIAEGNHVAVLGDWSGTFKGQMMGMKPTGKQFKMKDVDLFTFSEKGQIIDHHSVQSMQTILSQVAAAMK